MKIFASSVKLTPIVVFAAFATLSLASPIKEKLQAAESRDFTSDFLPQGEPSQYEGAPSELGDDATAALFGGSGSDDIGLARAAANADLPFSLNGGDSSYDNAEAREDDDSSSVDSDDDGDSDGSSEDESRQIVRSTSGYTPNRGYDRNYANYDASLRGQDSNIANARVEMSANDMNTAAGHHHHHHHSVHGMLDMGAHTGKKGAFGWHDKHPVGGKGR